MAKSAVVAGDAFDRAPTPLEWQAIHIAATAEVKRRRELVDVGNDQRVDVTLRVVADVDIGADTKQMTKDAPNAEEVLELTLHSMSKPMRKKLAEALTAKKARSTAVDESITMEAKRLLELMTTREPKPKKGAVTGAVTVELIARGGKPVPKAAAA